MPTIKTIYKAEWNALLNAIHRCHNPEHIAFKNYGARGITVCEEWREAEGGFDDFLLHIGPRPDGQHSLDRIDNDQGYRPGNVRWTDRKTQQNNRRQQKRYVTDYGWGIGKTPALPHVGRGSCLSALVPHAGKLQTVAEWARELRMDAATIRQRLERGMAPEQALSPQSYRGRHENRPLTCKSHLAQAVDAALAKLDLSIEAHDLFACTRCGSTGAGDGSDHDCDGR